MAAQHWASFDGWAAQHGINPLTLPVDRACNLIYWWATRNADQQERRKIDMQLTRGITRTADDEMQAVDQFAGMLDG